MNPARLKQLAFGLVAAIATAGALAAPAGAHPQSTSAIILDVRGDRVEGEVQLPVDRLAFGLDQPFTPENVTDSPHRSFLREYTADHIAATGADGEAWTVELGRGVVEKVDGVPHLVYPLTLGPESGSAGEFNLRYDVLIEELLTHKAFLSVRPAPGESREVLEVFSYGTESFAIGTGEDADSGGFVSSAEFGIHHVAEGADHLLFLLMLLIPAPLVAMGGRWQAGSSVRRSVVRIVHVVTAFAVGHSLTLALAGLGVINLPSRPIETLIALSIGVSAVHAIRPIVKRGEVLIAAGFGLVHGLAFATFLGDLGLNGGSLVSTLLGFNLGIELTQLLVVALCMPSLLVMARTRFYTPFRVVVATIGVAFSLSWMLERATVTPSDPFEGTQTWLAERPLLFAAALGVLALAAHIASRGGFSERFPARAEGKA